MREVRDEVGLVAVARTEPRYSDAAPYDPSEPYPEYPFGGGALGQTDNPAYRAVRDCLRRMHLDARHADGPDWNPLGDVIMPGQTVVLKPNFVIDRHYGGGELYAIVTHPSVIRAVADYCQIALKGRGRLILADAPVGDCDFDHLCETMQLDRIRDAYRERGALDLEIYDLRSFAAPPGNLVYAHRRKILPGDPAGNVIVDLGRDSALRGKTGPFFGADPSTRETNTNHRDGVHRYSLSKTILSSDVLISMPKLKVHKRVGVTLNFKGFVGANTNKNYLVHYTMGTPREGGDQTAEATAAVDTVILRVRRLINRVFFGAHRPGLEKLHHAVFHSRPYRALRTLLRGAGLKPSALACDTDGGGWYGNDSCWRMVADLARILTFCDANGRLHAEPRRRIVCLVDGIVGGEGTGPLLPDPKPAGVIVGGLNPLAVDLACCRLMGIDPVKMPLYRFLLEKTPSFGVSSPEAVRIDTSDAALEPCMRAPGRYLNFRPHKNWAGHIEISQE